MLGNQQLDILKGNQKGREPCMFRDIIPGFPLCTLIQSLPGVNVSSLQPASHCSKSILMPIPLNMSEAVLTMSQTSFWMWLQILDHLKQTYPGCDRGPNSFKQRYVRWFQLKQAHSKTGKIWQVLSISFEESKSLKEFPFHSKIIRR